MGFSVNSSSQNKLWLILSLIVYFAESFQYMLAMLMDASLCSSSVYFAESFQYMLAMLMDASLCSSSQQGPCCVDNMLVLVTDPIFFFLKRVIRKSTFCPELK